MPLDKQELRAGMQLAGTYKKRQYGCDVVQSDAGLRCQLEDGQIFTSLSAAGQAVMGGINCNGWHFWSLAPVEPSVVAGDGDPKPGEPRGLRIVRRLPNQRGVPEGQVRWFCSACMAGFLAPAGRDTVSCPQGHRREERDEA